MEQQPTVVDEMAEAKIGESCIFGQNCFVAKNVVIGNGKRMSVTIVTITYLNHKSRLKWLKEAIDSVLMQKGVDFDYVIVNDGSPVKIPPVWLADPRIKYFELPHSGRAVAANFGTAQGTGKYRCYIADDDYLIGKDSLATRYRLAEENPKAALIWTNGYKVDGQRKIIREFKDPKVVNGLEILRRGGIINGSSNIIPRDLWLQFKLDTQYTTAEELDQQIRLAKWSEDNGYHFQYFPQFYTAGNRQHSNQGSKNLSVTQKRMRKKIIANGKKLYGVK